MNERIQALIEQCKHTSTTYFDGRGNVTETYFDKEKFAELIVRETVKEMSHQLYWHGVEQSNNPSFYKAIEKTLEHFGVE